MEPMFTQRHYNYLAEGLAKITDGTIQHQTINILSEIFEKDNPRFSRDKFLHAIISKETIKLTLAI